MGRPECKARSGRPFQSVQCGLKATIPLAVALEWWGMGVGACPCPAENAAGESQIFKMLPRFLAGGEPGRESVQEVDRS
jgi:hypothetical protein